MTYIRVALIVAASGTLAVCIPAHAADPIAGQKTFEGNCTACHQVHDYAGKSEADLQTTLKGIVAGTVKHGKKLSLADADIANLAAYLSGAQAK